MSKASDYGLWEHYCEMEHATIGVGKGEECNWCGKTEEDFPNPNMISVEKITENKDGSADVIINISDEATKSLLVEGMKQIVEETKAKVVVLPVKEGQFSSDVKQYELTDEEAQLLLQMGFVKAMERGLEND